MAPSRRDLQLTPLSGDSAAEIGAMEEVRLLDSYDSLSKIEEGSGHSGLRKIQVGVTGMTCAACSNSVEGALMSVNGVFKASVALLQNRADVLFDPNLVKEEDIKEAIEDAGFEAEILAEPVTSGTKTQATLVGQFTIGGMTCAACVNSVEGILRDLPGVKRAVVALATSLGEVEYDPNVISKDDIVTAIVDAGFEGSLVQSNQQDKLLLRVEGVLNELDAQVLEGILTRLNGVRQFRLDRITGELELVFDPEVVSSRSLVDGIEGEGYGKFKLRVMPEVRAQIPQWFKTNVAPYSQRKGTLDPALDAAEAARIIVTVNQKGGANFKSINEAIKSIPIGNKKRVIIKLAPGIYTEKVTVDVGRPFVTLLGQPGSQTVLTYHGTAAQYGTVESATLIIWSDYFMAANLIIKNTSPMPKPGSQGQALAMRINGDYAAFYTCSFYGFQDTLCDDKGNHFFKDCYIEGTYDFIFGRGASLYLNTKLHAVGDGLRVITAQSRQSNTEQNGYTFVHCKITGTGTGIYLGRSWMSHPKVIYAFTEMTSVVNPSGWRENFNRAYDKTVFYGEYKCFGPGSHQEKRVPYTQDVDQNEVRPFLTLGYIKGSKWLLPPPKY